MACKVNIWLWRCLACEAHFSQSHIWKWAVQQCPACEIPHLEILYLANALQTNALSKSSFWHYKRDRMYASIHICTRAHHIVPEGGGGLGDDKVDAVLQTRRHEFILQTNELYSIMSAAQKHQIWSVIWYDINIANERRKERMNTIQWWRPHRNIRFDPWYDMILGPTNEGRNEWILFNDECRTEPSDLIRDMIWY